MIEFKGTVSKEDYVHTNINADKGIFTIKLKDGFEYFVLSILEKNGSAKRKLYFIQKGGKYYKLDDEVKKMYIIEKRKYLRWGI